MSEAEELLSQQLQDWEKREAEAEEVLRVARAAIPALRQSLAEIRGQRPEPTPSEEAAPLPPSPVEIESEEGFASGKEIRDSAAVKEAVRKFLPLLGADRFTQPELQDLMAGAGVEVNRSTLRGNLGMMAQLRDSLEVAEEGRGRRATIFRRL